MKELTLSELQLNALRSELREPTTTRTYRRAAALLALHEGRAATEIAELLGVSRQTVYNWLSSYGQAESVLELGDAYRSGRPSVWTQQLDVALRQALDKAPGEFGLTGHNWSATLLQEYLARLVGAQISTETVRRGLRRLGYHWDGDKYVPRASAEILSDSSQLKTAFASRNAIAA